jgi:hypothetical protein
VIWSHSDIACALIIDQTSRQIRPYHSGGAPKRVPCWHPHSKKLTGVTNVYLDSRFFGPYLADTAGAVDERDPLDELGDEEEVIDDFDVSTTSFTSDCSCTVEGLEVRV